LRQLNIKQGDAADLGNVVQVKTDATEPLQSGGALMLGGDQDCYGSCTDPTQAFNGLMDEVLSALVSACRTSLKCSRYANTTFQSQQVGEGVTPACSYTTANAGTCTYICCYHDRYAANAGPHLECGTQPEGYHQQHEAGGRHSWPTWLGRLLEV